MIWLAGLPVIWWVAILLADAIQPGRNLFELMEVLTEKLNHPFQFHYTEYTIKSMLVCTSCLRSGFVRKAVKHKPFKLGPAEKAKPKVKVKA